MKFINLVLREDLLEEATRLSGEKTYSRTVEKALEEFVRRAKARKILERSPSHSPDPRSSGGSVLHDPGRYVGLDRSLFGARARSISKLQR